MHRFFIKTYYLIRKNRLLSLGIAFLFLALGIFFTTRIKFEEDISQIIPKSENADVTAKVLKQLNFSDKITVLIERKQEGQTTDLSVMATQFVDSLERCKPYIKDIQGVVAQENITETFDFVYDNLPLFLDEQDYKAIEQKLVADSITQQVQSNYRSLIAPSGMISRDFILKDPLGLTFIALKKLRQLNLGDDFELKNGYLTTKDGNSLLLFINPKLKGSETQQNTLFVNQLHSIKENLNTTFKGKVELSYFGSTLIAVANANQIKNDIHYTVAISMCVLMLLLILFYRKLTIPLLLFLPPLSGTLAGLTTLYFLKDAISAISLGIGAVLLGVTIDYSLHILTHYKKGESIEGLYKDITKPLLISSSTTAIAFLCLVFVHSEALKDLGVFAAVSVMVSALVSLLVIPQLYTPKEDKERNTLVDRIAGFSFDKNKIVIGTVAVVTVAGAFFATDIQYNTDLSTLNYVPQDIKQTQDKLEKTSSVASKSIYTVAYGKTIEEALQHNSILFDSLVKKKNEGTIKNFSSIGGIVLSRSEQEEKIEQWNRFWTSDRQQFIEHELVAQTSVIGFRPETHTAFYQLLKKEFTPLSLAQYSALKTLFIDEFVSQKEGLVTLTSVVKVDSNEQRDHYIKDISNIEQIIPIDRQQLNETFLGKLKLDFERLINYSFIAILLVLFYFFRRIELVLIGALPIVITGFVVTGLMVLFHIELNIFSTIVCTLIFGHGVDFSIFMTSAMIKEYTYGKDDIKTYRASILLAVLTTVLAVGVLVFAKHPALLSISIVSLIGILTAVVVTFVFYPILFRFFISNRPKKGKMPVGVGMFIYSTILFIYYGFGGAALSIFGQLILKLAPVKKTTRMTWFRKLMSSFVKSVLYGNPLVKKTVINEHHETFDKPAVIIANHTSFLDTLAVGMITHKMIFLVNDWVYNSPVFGRAVKLAGFYPVSKGLDGSVDHLKPKIEEGYSLMIFPEGQRSYTNAMGRFHKGAFFLAEQLNLDVLPVYIHGNSEVLPKGNHIIYHGEQITVKVGKRIKADDLSFGKNYTERTKKISTYFKSQFAEIREQVEDEDYFKRKLLMSFMYKDREIQQLIKEDFHTNKGLYHAINKYLPKEAKIANISNDYGQLDVLLTLQEPQRKVYTFITDQEKKGIAKNNYWVGKRNIYYVDSLSEIFERSTCLVSNCLTEEFIANCQFEKIETVITVTNCDAKNQLIQMGYAVFKEEKELVIFKKQS
ncbi:MAG: 1-acyl-sn-glycerol-3-phosphate acyltransferase [Flavobacteriales bacterium]|nr:1-acyl-sn-glycerol-3-phosphate acyltransferase [Flavobacteriales bacterium]